MFGYIGFGFVISTCIALSTSDTQPDVIAANNAAVEMTVLEGLAGEFRDIFRRAYRDAILSAEADGYFDEYESTGVTAGKDDIITNRRKRSPLTLAARAYAAVQKLIKGATAVPANSKRYRLYEKTGDFERAKADFESVSPRYVKDLSGGGFNSRSSAGKIYMGLVGDRRIFLREIGVKGDKFRPTIEVSEAKMGSDSQTLLTFKDAQTQYNVADCQDDRVSDSLIAQASANGTAKLATANGCRRLVKSLNLDRPSTTD